MLVSTSRPRACAVPLAQRRQNADHGDQRADRHGDHHVRRRRHAVPGEQAQQPGVPEKAQIVSGTIRVGAGLAEPGERAPDQARVHGPELSEADSRPVQRTRTSGLDQHVGIRGQAAQDRRCRVVTKIESHGALPVVVRRVSARDRSQQQVAWARLFDAQDLSAEIGQQPGAEGAGV